MSRVPLRWRILLAFLRRSPQGVLSRGTGWLAERTIPSLLRGPVIRGFAGLVGADLEEAARPPAAFESVSQFFSRRLAEGVRSWPDDPGVPASPVDGVLGSMGRIRDGQALQAKGRPYGVDELVGAGERARDFEGGHYLTIYLSPRHYHRIHAPVGAEIPWAAAVPGALLPVNQAAVRTIPRLFPRNERLVAGLRPHEGGTVAVVAVGAFNVGRISAAFDPEWNGLQGGGVTNRPNRRQEGARRYEPPVPVERGEEIMAFHLGSTVVLLFCPESSGGRTFHADLETDREIRLGAPLFGSG